MFKTSLNFVTHAQEQSTLIKILTKQIKALENQYGYVRSNLWSDLIDKNRLKLEIIWSNYDSFSNCLVTNYLDNTLKLPSKCLNSFTISFESNKHGNANMIMDISNLESMSVLSIKQKISGTLSRIVESYKSKYASSNISNEQIDDYLLRIKQFMETEKPFLDKDLTLIKFSENLDIHPHHVSRVINEKTGLNFSNFVNQYRVKYSKNLLIEDLLSKYTISGIGNEAGFNSRSAFYNSFKKFTGMSPGDYIHKDDRVLACA
jgi:AraC-like DNA-binding protein